MTDSRLSPTAPSAPLWTRHLRREVQVVLDLVVLVAAFALAYSLRFEFSVPPEYLRAALVQLPVVVLIEITVLLLTGVYQFVWRYIGLNEVLPFVRGAAYSALPLLLMRFALPASFQEWRIPLSVVLLNLVFAFGGTLTLRVLRRVLYERFEREASQPKARRAHKRTLLVGAGRAGVLAIREIHARGDLEIEPVGFIDDDPLKLGTIIHGTKVLGATREMPELLRDLDIQQTIITMAVASPQTVRKVVEACERAGVEVKIIPGLHELLRGSVSIARFRNVQIEDILGREPVRLDNQLVRTFLGGKSVLVTGAGGSIGGELARQIARFNPLRLVLVERAEGALFEIDRELRQIWPQLELLDCVADAGDETRMSQVLAQTRPHVVFHAAAHKHVPLMESNPGEAVKNNVLATRSLGQQAAEHGADAFVLVSTDKAVRPASIMGATKRLAELVVQDLDRRFESTRFLAVRFGNVLGSTGSVVPIFRQQIQAGGPVTVTHPEARRYFMTISEAAQLVLEAGAIGDGGAILMLDMGKPMKILDLAKEMITLSGFQPFEDIQIVFTGLRPGEKLAEELQLSDETIDHTVHPKIFAGRLAASPSEELERCLAELTRAVTEGDAGEVRRLLSQIVTEAELERRHTVAMETTADDRKSLVH